MADPVPIVVPQAGMNMVEATIVIWQKDVGDQVQEGEPIVDIETDKVDMQIEAPATGTLIEIIVPAGEDAEVGATLGLVQPA